MKLYRGKKRLAAKFLHSDRQKDLEWALTIKPGDYIGTCEGCNRQVVSIRQIWRNEGQHSRGKSNKTWFLDEMVFIDTHGHLHYCPGGGCAFPAEPPQKVTDFFRGFFANPDLAISLVSKSCQAFRKAFQEGRPIVDVHGELLPEFEEGTYSFSNIEMVYRDRDDHDEY